MARSAKQWFWRVVVALGLIVLAVLLWAGWYLNSRGFPRNWRDQLAAELRSRGLDFSASRLRLNPFEGLVAENAQLYLLDENHTHLMFISRAAVDIDFIKLIQKKPFLNSLDLRGARLTVPVDLGDHSSPKLRTGDHDSPKLRLSRFQAKLIFLPGEVQITQAEGVLQGIQVSVSGSLLHPESFTAGTGPPPTREVLERRRQMARTIIAEIEKIRSDGAPPRVEARFSGDLARLDDLRVEVQLRGDGIRHGRYRLETLRAQINFERGALHLQGLQMADARGKLSASGEFNPATGEARFQLDSGLDLPALTREFLPSGERWLEPFIFHEAPHLRIDNGQVRLASSSEEHTPPPVPAPTPTAAPGPPSAAGGGRSSPPPAVSPVAFAAATPASAAFGASSLRLTGHLSLGRCAFRAVEFEGVETDFSWSDDRWYLRGVHLSKRDNSAQQITADILSEPGLCRVRVSSTFDPTALAPLLPARGRAMLGEWKFQDAPRIELNASGKSLADPESFRADGRLNLGRTHYRGVALNQGQSEFTYGDHALGYRHFTIERDEGVGTGDLFVYDFGRHEARVENVRATLDPAQVAVWIDPDVARAVAPFRFRKPPATVTNGVVQFDGGRNSRLTVDINAPGGMEYTFVRRPLVFQSVVGRALFTDDRLRLNDMRGEIFGGQMRGSLDLSLVRGAPNYSAAMEVHSLDFARLTKLFFDYDTSQGQLAGFYRFTGRGDDPRALQGVGQLQVERGNVFAIPFMGPLSGILGKALPNFGMDVAHQASANFQTNNGKIYTGKIDVKGAAFSLSCGGWLGYTDDTMNMRVQVNTRGLPGAVLSPVSWLLEYSSQGPLSKPVWKPRIFTPAPPLGTAVAAPATAGSTAPAAVPTKQP